MAATSVAKTKDLALLHTELSYDEIKGFLNSGLSDSQIEMQNAIARERVDERIRKWTVKYFSAQEQEVQEERKELNLMLLGKTGAGKSATGNLLVGKKKHYETRNSSESCTQCIKTGEGVVDDINLCVVDTPGFCDTKKEPKAILTEIGKTVDYFNGGIDAFLYVYNIANIRFTEEERKGFLAMEKELFGKESLAYCFVILTCAETCIGWNLNEFLEVEKGTDFGDILVNKFEKRVIAVNNATTSPYEREELRKQIIRMITTRRQGRYTPEDWKKFQTKKWKLADESPECIRFLCPIVEKLVFPHLEQKTYSEIKHMTTKDCSDIIDSVLKEVMTRKDVEQVWKEKIKELIERILKAKRDRYTSTAELIVLGLTAAQVLATGLGVAEGVAGLVLVEPELTVMAGAHINWMYTALENIKARFK